MLIVQCGGSPSPVIIKNTKDLRFGATKELSTNNLLNYTSSLQYELYRFRILNEQVIHGRPSSIVYATDVKNPPSPL